MVVVKMQHTTDAGASLLPLQTVERLVESTLEGSGKGHWIEREQIPAYGDI